MGPIWDQFEIEIVALSPFAYAISALVHLSIPSSKTTKTTKNTETLSDFRAVSWRCHPDSNWGIKVLQTFALPLGYGTVKNGAVDEARTRDLNLGKVALYQLSYYRIKCWIGAGEETRTLTSLTPDPKSGASAIPPRPLDFYQPRGVVTHRRLELRTP